MPATLFRGIELDAADELPNGTVLDLVGLLALIKLSREDQGGRIEDSCRMDFIAMQALSVDDFGSKGVSQGFHARLEQLPTIHVLVCVSLRAWARNSDCAYNESRDESTVEART